MKDMLHVPPEWLPAPFTCPRCNNKAYIKTHKTTRRPILICCSKCPWDISFREMAKKLRAHREQIYAHHFDLSNGCHSVSPDPNPYNAL